jgi:hypothetical protein
VILIRKEDVVAHIREDEWLIRKEMWFEMLWLI